MSQELTLEIFNDVVRSLNKQIADLNNQISAQTRINENLEKNIWATHSFIGEKYNSDFEEHFGSVAVWYDAKLQRQEEARRIRGLTQQLEYAGYVVLKKEDGAKTNDNVKIKKAK